MATVIPPSLPPDTPGSERKVYAALSRLPDPWYVLHSVAWQSVRDGRPGDGEADFVLIHPSRGVLVIEVKGGGVRIEGGQWITQGADGTHPIKDPFEQATSSKHALIRYLRENHLDIGMIPAGHAVAFPDLASIDRLGPAAPPAVVITRSELDDIEQTIEELSRHWDLSGWKVSEKEAEGLVALLAPTTHVRRLLVDEVAEVNARLMALTDQQVAILRAMRRIRRAIVEGGAGTGKTVLATERARMLAAENFRVLLTCFNRPLAEHLAAQFRGVDNVLVYSFHALCRWQISTAGLDFPDVPTSEWWDEEAADLLVEGAHLNGFEVDAVVVDEGQDFRPDWFDSLLMLLGDPDDGPMYVFVDGNQALYHDEWRPPFPAEPHVLTLNCRNTRPIGRVVASVFDSPWEEWGADGPEPELVAVESDEGAIKAVRRLLHTWVNEGKLRPDQVAVLCQRKEMAQRLRAERLAGLDLNGIGRGGVTCETIHRFKGLEADAVILIVDEMTSTRHLRLFYVGASRARSLLAVVGPAGAIKPVLD